MDNIDLKILNILQRNNMLSAEKIGESVGLSPSAVQRRIQHLRAKGVIESDVSIISHETVGLRLIVIVEVTLESEHSHVIQDFKNLMIAAQEVTQCYYVTGQADFILTVVVKDMQDYVRFTDRCFSGNPNVKRFTTNVVINKVKSELQLQFNIE